MGSVCALDTGHCIEGISSGPGEHCFPWWRQKILFLLPVPLMICYCVQARVYTFILWQVSLSHRNQTQQHGKMVGTGKDALERGWAISTFQVSTLSLQEASYVCVRGTAGVCHPDRSGIAHGFRMTQAPKKFPEKNFWKLEHWPEAHGLASSYTL